MDEDCLPARLSNRLFSFSCVLRVSRASGEYILSAEIGTALIPFWELAVHQGCTVKSVDLVLHLHHRETPLISSRFHLCFIHVSQQQMLAI
jgi:hypothetical protein